MLTSMYMLSTTSLSERAGQRCMKADRRFLHLSRLRRLTTALGCETLLAAGREPSGDMMYQDNLSDKCVKWLVRTGRTVFTSGLDPWALIRCLQFMLLTLAAQ